jgi:hypothetical protein
MERLKRPCLCARRRDVWLGRGPGRPARKRRRRARSAAGCTAGQRAAARPPVSGTAVIATGSSPAKRSPSGTLSGLSSETFAALCSANLGGRVQRFGGPGDVKKTAPPASRASAERGRPPSTTQIRFPESDGRSRNFSQARSTRMSTYYGLRKSIKADELFDGRLEALRERCARSGRSLSEAAWLALEELGGLKQA